ncbi:hypothetical protein KV205_27895 [Streptomyces sp. SKN60]|uniref:FlgD immunoglobulin-like domain containing protein n=1 Tax=Streptomyces sp. SKN60 TaxID=2855506 RepID=UPI002245BD6A|nr:FlgD immunoglobulin-like domain containing protein [Streptomyces sp. SKN60]MCX2184323.1 hypothetical protein [Streptomyces sp. SKN60]
MIRTWSGRRVTTAVAAVAFGAALLSVAPAGPVGTGMGTAVAAEAAEPPGEVVIPAELSADPYAGRFPVVGLTGFVQGGAYGGYHWISYADGTRTKLPFLSPRPTGTDMIAILGSTFARLYDPATNTTQTVQAPSGQQTAAMVGRSLLTFETADRRIWHLLTLDQGSGTVQDRSVSLPEGATEATAEAAHSPYGSFLSYRLDGIQRRVWLDRSLTLHPMPPKGTTGDVVADRYYFRFTEAGRVQVWDLTGDLSAPLHEADWAGGKPVALLGDRILARVPGEGGDRLVARPLAGGAEQEVLDRITGDTVAGPDGRVVAARSGSGDERMAYAVRAGENGGAPVAGKIADIPPAPARIGRMSAAQGVLLSYEQLPYTTPRVRERMVTTGGELAAGPKRELTGDGVCGAQVDCEGAQTGDGRTVFSGSDGSLRVVEAGQQLPGTALTGLPRPSGVWQVSGRYVTYVTAPEAGGERQVADLDTQQVLLRRPGGVLSDRAVAMEGDTYWEESSRTGEVEAFDVRTGAWKWSRTVSDCDLTDLQVNGGYLYWRCANGKDGVQQYGPALDIPLPAHDTAQLGNGFIVHTKGHELSLTPLREAGPTRLVATLPQDNHSWTVDRFGGHLYYADAQQRIHVVPSGVPASAVSVIDADTPQVLDLESAAGASWTGRFWLNKPAASWTLTMKDRTGAVVRTLTGGEARGLVKAGWDGKGEDGAALADGRYEWTLTAAPADGSGPEPRRVGEVFLTRGGLGTYEPVEPARVLDTRSGLGAPKAKVGPRGTVTLQVAGRGGVVSAGVTAVVLNVTAVNPTQSTFVSVYPYGTQRPTSSSLNAAAGRTVPNLVTVPVKDGKVTLYNHAGAVDLVADVAGYYTLSGEGDRFLPVEPARVLDTRSGLGAPKAKVGAARTVSVQVAGRGGVPATGVSAVVLNVTATGPTASSFVSVYPYGSPRPSASNLNVVAGQTVANLVVVPVRDGKVTLYNHAGSVDLLADVSGYFTASGPGDRFRPLPPQRVMDTRENWMALKLGPDQSAVLEIAGIGGVPATGASAVVLNVTATNATASTYIAVHPTLTDRPVNSNLNLGAGQTVANQVIVPVVNGRITFYNRAGSTDVIVDVFGYYTD